MRPVVLCILRLGIHEPLGGTMGKLAVGDKAPDFNLKNQDGEPVALSSYRGRKVVVYFYPRDDTPGCTKEACQFNDLRSQFVGLSADVIGISRDGADSHQKFRQKYGLTFELLSDPDNSVMEAFGAWGEKTNYGKTSMGVIRSTFLIGADGNIEQAWYNVKADGHADKVLEALKA
jgi:thioredoxin-dependent peroxiredoxin